jgi:SAM-dependent methyltransferase
MKNTINEKPWMRLDARLKKSLDFVDQQDIEGKRVLDIGYGFAWFEYWALKKKVAKIVGVEPEVNNKYFSDARCSFRAGSAIDLPFRDGTFETVVAWEVIEHIPSGTETKMFAEARRLLKKNGCFYVSTPNQNIWSNLLDPAWWLIGHRHYAVNGLIALASGAGFEVESSEIVGGFWMAINILNLYFAKWIFRRKRFLEEFFYQRELDEFSRRDGFMNIFMKFRKT